MHFNVMIVIVDEKYCKCVEINDVCDILRFGMIILLKIHVILTRNWKNGINQQVVYTSKLYYERQCIEYSLKSSITWVNIECIVVKIFGEMFI